MRQADRLRAKFVVVIGEQELKSRSAILKNMANGEETPVPFDRLDSVL